MSQTGTTQTVGPNSAAAKANFPGPGGYAPGTQPANSSSSVNASGSQSGGTQ